MSEQYSKEMVIGKDCYAEKDAVTLSDLVNYAFSWYSQARILSEIRDACGPSGDPIKDEETEIEIAAAFIREQAAEIIAADLFYEGDRRRARSQFALIGIDSEQIPDDLCFAFVYPDRNSKRGEIRQNDKNG